MFKMIMKTAEKFFRSKIKEQNPNIEIVNLSQELITAEQGMRWAHEFKQLHLHDVGNSFTKEEVVKKVTPKQILELINRLPDAESHIHICCIDGKHCVTNEWFAGNFAGRSFEADNYEDATQQLIDYMYEHIGHNSMVGKSVTESGFPNLEKVYEYCKPKVLIEDEP